MSKRSKIIIAAVLTLLIVVILFQELRVKTLEYDFVFYRSVPDIELWYIDDTARSGFIDIRGFVVFDNMSDQPKDLRQYYVIKSTTEHDQNGNRIYTLDETIKMNLLPPREFDTVLLTEQAEDLTTLELADAAGNKFFIDKVRQTVRTLDATGDSTYLITDMDAFGNFMRDFLLSR